MTMLSSSSHPITKIPILKLLLIFNRNILYDLGTKNKEKLKTIFLGQWIF